MNLQSIFRDFNPGKFIVWVCLAIFTLLYSLRLDNGIDWSYWVVFSPLWVWKALVISGACIGDFVWWRNPHYRLENQSYTQFRALIISLCLHIFLLIFEILVCNNMEKWEEDDKTPLIPWIAVFSPLIIVSMVSVGACIWAVKHDRSFELELFCSMNLLQFIFIALRLDDHIDWPWEILFVPAWIMLIAAVFAVFYSIIYALILMIVPDLNLDRKRTSLNSACGYTCLFTPMLIALISLAKKLNRTSEASYFATLSPLYVSFATLILMSFSTKRANQWWFGLRKDLCQFLLGMCPLLQEYANISYSMPQRRESSRVRLQDVNLVVTNERKESTKPKIDRAVVPSLSLEVPD